MFTFFKFLRHHYSLYVEHRNIFTICVNGLLL